MTTKEFISPASFLHDSFQLARKIYESGYRPDLMLVIWRGGAPVGLAVHEYFRYKGFEVRQEVARAESYTGIEQRTEPRVENMDSILSSVARTDKVLIVDDIYDTGSTVRVVKALLASKTGEVRIATQYIKKGHIVCPDYYLREVTGWLVFPHEIADLSMEEIGEKDEFIHSLLL